MKQPANTSKSEAERLALKYGPQVLQGQTLQEQQAMVLAANFTVILTGGQSCLSLRDTALSGGC